MSVYAALYLYSVVSTPAYGVVLAFYAKKGERKTLLDYESKRERETVLSPAFACPCLSLYFFPFLPLAFLHTTSPDCFYFCQTREPDALTRQGNNIGSYAKLCGVI